MTKEEAIYALELVEHIESISVLYSSGEPINQITISEMKQACRIAVDALHDKHRINLNKSEFGCEYCKGDLEGYTSTIKEWMGPGRMYIPEGESNLVVSGMYKHRACIPIQFCPKCGCPLTEEAWLKLEKKIGGL